MIAEIILISDFLLMEILQTSSSCCKSNVPQKSKKNKRAREVMSC